MPTTVTDAELVEMYLVGFSLRAIAIQIGQSHQYVCRHLARKGITRRPLRKGGPDHSQWKGGRVYAGQGYWRQQIGADDPVASMRDHHGYVKARKLDRPLLPTETVHHIDGDRSNNDPANLELRQGKHGKGVAIVCLDCGSHNVGHRTLP